MFYFDYLIYMLPALLLGLVAQLMVKSAYSRFSKVASRRGLTGEQAARAVLEGNGVMGVTFGRVAGELTDHFDPKSNRINLSSAVGDGTSVASIGVAAHEAGHAVQYSCDYFPIRVRSALVPVCNFGSKLGLILILISFAISYTAEAWSVDLLYWIGLILFSTTAVFQLVTLPVEFDASKRAMKALEGTGILDSDELKGARRVLTAAAMTYVAALVSSVMQILYYASRFRRRD